MLIALTVDMFQLYRHIVQHLQGSAPKEERCFVIAVEQWSLLICDNRCQLLQVANHQQLHPAKRQTTVTETSQHMVYRIKQVATHHAYLVDNQQIHRADDTAFLCTEIETLFEGGIRNIRRQRQLEKRVDGHTSGIDGRHTRRCYDHHPFGKPFVQRLQKSRLSRSSLPRQEDADTCILHKIPCRAKFMVDLSLMGTNAFCCTLRHDKSLFIIVINDVGDAPLALMVETPVIRRVVQDFTIQIKHSGAPAIQVQGLFSAHYLDEVSQFGKTHPQGIPWRATVHSDEQYPLVLGDSYGAARMFGG